MDQSTIQWQRFWSPREAQIVLGDNGFLINPESDWGRSANPDLRAVDLLSECPCIVLLGEPGSGKSTTLESEVQSVKSNQVEAEQDIMLLDLHDVESDYRLADRLFKSDQFNEWKRSDRELILFLDSLDECRIQISTLPNTLLHELRQCPTDRLRLRIACRTADWPPSLEQGLKEIWGRDFTQVFELAPLRRLEVEHAATASGIDPKSFIEAVQQAEAVPLAIKPLTLDLLLRTFRQQGALPARQADLVRDGCLLLCEESEQRQELRLPRLLEAEQRLAIAKRMAALTVFANRAAIWIGVNRGDIPDDDLTIRELSGGTENVNRQQIDVDAESVKETLNTGLFSSRGPRRLGWSHQSYAEFLAASYVIDRDFSLPQILSLIVPPDDPEGRLVPQLHETAAWLAGMRADVFGAILARDPEVLLRSDVSGTTETERLALVGALLQATEEGRWIDRDWGLRQNYGKLKHAELASQLRSYILDSTKEVTVRRVAIHIAEACAEDGLCDDLVTTALDANAPLEVRIPAAYAIIDIGNEFDRGRLRELIDTSTAVDPDAELKGCGLQATWPTLLSTEVLLSALNPAPSNLLGSYRSFLYQQPFRELPPSDLPIALSWSQTTADHATIPFELDRLVDEIMDLAKHHLADPTVLASFSKVFLTRIRHHDPVLEGVMDLNRARPSHAEA